MELKVDSYLPLSFGGIIWVNKMDRGGTFVHIPPISVFYEEVTESKIRTDIINQINQKLTKKIRKISACWSIKL